MQKENALQPGTCSLEPEGYYIGAWNLEPGTWSYEQSLEPVTKRL